VKRREVRDGADALDDFVGDAHRLAEPRAAVNHAVAQRVDAERPARLDRVLRGVRGGLGRDRPFLGRRAGRLQLQTRLRRPPLLHQAPRQQHLVHVPLGEGALAGGITIRTAHGTFELTDLRSDLRGGLASGKCAVNGVYAEHGSVLRCGLDEARLSTQSVPPGSPMKVRLTQVPLRATPDLIAAYASVLGAAPFTTDTTLAHLTAEGMYHPPTAWARVSR